MRTSLHQFKAELFKALAHPARVHILELLRQGEMTVSELQAQLEIDPSSVSQHLSVLRGRQIIEGRKAGTSVHYRVLDEQIFAILDAARETFETHVEGLQGLLAAERGRDSAGGRRGRPGVEAAQAGRAGGAGAC